MCLTLKNLPPPAATGTMCSNFVEHRSWLLVYLYEYVVVGHVVCMSVCVCLRDTCMSDRIVFVLLCVYVQN